MLFNILVAIYSLFEILRAFILITEHLLNKFPKKVSIFSLWIFRLIHLSPIPILDQVTNGRY